MPRISEPAARAASAAALAAASVDVAYKDGRIGV
jgi:hypothetical protein